MLQVQDIHIEDFDYELPNERIARFPLRERDLSKLLIWKNGQISASVFRCLSDFIPADSLIVFNNTRVIQARLIFQKMTGAQIEIFCLDPKSPPDYAQIFACTQSCNWLCLLGNARRWKSGKLIRLLDDGTQLYAERLQSNGDTHLIRFEWDNQALTFADILEQCGELPIPPYLNRKTEESDKQTYQTVYSKIQGSVAAPTAGLHFTDDVFQSLAAKNIATEELTLHVGAGTFKPVKTETLSGHVMHSEYFSIKKIVIEQLIHKAGKVIAVGTTSVRTLESLYYIGEMLAKKPNANPDELVVSQWMPYSPEFGRLSMNEALQNLVRYLENHCLDELKTHTQILIAPTYQFKIVNGLITNFHQPKSTLLLLISAFVGGRWREIYDYAMRNDFRFLSYGDSSLLMK